MEKNCGSCAYSIISITDFLELTLQFGMIMMFACAFPLIFCFAALVCGFCHKITVFCFDVNLLMLLELFSLQNNATEIRADALKLLVMLKRPVPRAAATIGAWLNIFQVCFLNLFDS